MKECDERNGENENRNQQCGQKGKRECLVNEKAEVGVPDSETSENYFFSRGSR